MRKRKKIRWGTKEIDIPLFESSRIHPKLRTRRYDVKLIYMKPKQFIKAQYKINPKLKKKYIDKELYKSMKKRKIPVPILEITKSGKLSKKWQEGYRRGMVAKKLRQKKMPVWIAKRRFH